MVKQHKVAEVLWRDTRTEYTLDDDVTIIEAEKGQAQWTCRKEKGVSAAALSF